MKKETILGLSGILLLIISAFLPLAQMNGQPITMAPVFNNIIIDDIWGWVDISAFAVTYFLATLICAWFIWDEKHIGIFILIS